MAFLALNDHNVVPAIQQSLFIDIAAHQSGAFYTFG
tara:strand:+ start:2952 stop:3059 length:108 start_codon:yes stop_codon:yes gene_type:complete